MFSKRNFISNSQLSSLKFENQLSMWLMPFSKLFMLIKKTVWAYLLCSLSYIVNFMIIKSLYHSLLLYQQKYACCLYLFKFYLPWADLFMVYECENIFVTGHHSPCIKKRPDEIKISNCKYIMSTVLTLRLKQFWVR